MSDNFVERIEKERKKLDKKITKLNSFINCPVFETLDELQKDLLSVQVTAMATYSNTLGARLRLLNEGT